MYTDASDPHKESPPIRGVVVPVCLVVVAFALWTGFQTTQLLREHGTLQAIRASQETAVQEAAKLRTQLDAIARGTQELANQGNQNAKTIVAELQKRGITITVPPPAEPTKK
jgi:hypothetical protein